MTNEQSAIFRKVLDTNWEVKELTEAGKWKEAMEKINAHNDAVKELKESMGEEEYNKFINTGRRMFAPIGSDDGDEDLDDE
jgi:hypothetical protein